MNHDSMLIETYLSDDKMQSIGHNIDVNDIEDDDAMCVIEQVIATCWFGL